MLVPVVYSSEELPHCLCFADRASLIGIDNPKTASAAATTADVGPPMLLLCSAAATAMYKLLLLISLFKLLAHEGYLC